MPKLLGRSKSFRLRPSQNEVSAVQSGKSTPLPPDATSQIDLRKLKDGEAGTRVDLHRVETPDPVHRPRTSNGLEDRTKLFHKKVAPVVLSSHSQEIFNFPVPSSPEAPSIMYAAEVHENGTIGMALGSPRTMSSKWNHDYVTGQTSTVTSISYVDSIADSTETLPEAKPKLSRWKSLFGKKSHQPQQNTPFYQLQNPSSQRRADSHHDVHASAQQAFKSESRLPLSKPAPVERKDTRKRSKSIKKNAAEVDKSNGRRPATSGRDESPPTPPKDHWRSPASIPKLTVSSGSGASTPRTLGGSLMLDVDIPRIEMERYSVMFGSLLKPDEHPSDLFTRRQGNAERLKPLTQSSKKNDGGLLKPVRRATSPSHTSPTFSLTLFPKSGSASEDKTPLSGVSSLNRPRPRPLHRSNTAPTTSPSRPMFIRSATELETEPSRTSRILEDHMQQSPEMIAEEFQPTPSTRNSFDSNSEGVAIVVAKAPSYSTPQVREPQWEIISKPKDIVSPRAALSSNPVSPDAHTDNGSAVEAKRSPLPGRSVTVSKHKKKVSVGVARTVSVSRAGGVARRELMRPMVSAPNLQEVLVDRKVLTPTLVELSHRKSQRIQLVDD